MAPPNSATPGAAQKALQESCSRALALQGMKYNPQPGLACLPRLVGAQLRGFYMSTAFFPSPEGDTLATPWQRGRGTRLSHFGRKTDKKEQFKA